MEPISYTSSSETLPIPEKVELKFPVETFLSKEEVVHSLTEKKVKVRQCTFCTESFCFISTNVMFIECLMTAICVLAISILSLWKQLVQNAAISVPSIFGGLSLIPITLLLPYSIYKLNQYLIARRDHSKNKTLDVEMAILNTGDSSKPIQALDFISLDREIQTAPELAQKLSFRQVKKIKQHDLDTFASIRKYLSTTQQTLWNKLDFLECPNRTVTLTTLQGEYFRTKLKETQGLFEEAVQRLQVRLADDEILEAVKECAQSLLTDLPPDQISKIIDDVALGASLTHALKNISLDEGDSMIKLSNDEEMAFIPKSTLLKTSEYFHSFFHIKPTSHEIDMSNLTTAAFRTLVHYLRHHEITINAENIESFIVIADHFQIEELIKECEKHLIRFRQSNSIEENLTYLETYRSLRFEFFDYVDQSIKDMKTLPPLFSHHKAFKKMYDQVAELKLPKSRETLDSHIESEIFAYAKKWLVEKNLNSFLADMDLVRQISPTPRIKKTIFSIIETRLQTFPDELKTVFQMAIKDRYSWLNEALIMFSENPTNEEDIERFFPSKEGFMDQLNSQEEGPSDRAYSESDSLI